MCFLYCVDGFVSRFNEDLKRESLLIILFDELPRK